MRSSPRWSPCRPTWLVPDPQCCVGQPGVCRWWSDRPWTWSWLLLLLLLMPLVDLVVLVLVSVLVTATDYGHTNSRRRGHDTRNRPPTGRAPLPTLTATQQYHPYNHLCMHIYITPFYLLYLGHDSRAPSVSEETSVVKECLFIYYLKYDIIMCDYIL